MIIRPAIIAEITDIPSAEGGFCIAGPMAWNTTAAQMAIESISAIDGNHVSEKGELHGTSLEKLQDTYLFGTGGRTGKPFVAVAGTVVDTWTSTRTGKYGLLVANSADIFDIQAHDPDTRIVAANAVLRRGAKAVANTAPSASNYFTYLELCYGGSLNWRIAMEWGKPLRLDYYTGGTWYKGIDISKHVQDIEQYLAQNNNQITFKILPDYTDGTLTIRCGNFVALKHAPPTQLPAFGNVRISGQNGWMTFEYYPLRFQPLVILKGTRDAGSIQAVGGMSVALNSRGASSLSQNDAVTLTGDGQNIGYSVTSTLPDAGDGLGSPDPAKGIDYTLVVPAVWVDPVPTAVAYPPVIQAALLETLDDATRTLTSSAILPIGNHQGTYTRATNQVSVKLRITTGYDPYTWVFRGVGGWGPKGYEVFQQDPVRLVTLPCSDNSVKMQIPLNEEVCFDGWYIRNAVEFLMECGNIRRSFLRTTLPPYIPPDGSFNAPYGPAGPDCPATNYILPSGTGLQAKYQFLPDWTPWDVLQRLVQDLGETDILTGQNNPYYMGFTPDGYFNFQPYNPRTTVGAPAITFSDWDPTGYGKIEEIRVYNSVYQMRTSIDFQGVDAFTNELLFYHLNMPSSVLTAVGYRWPWLERDARFASQAYMQQIANNASVQAGMPTKCWVIRVPYHPWLRAGMTCLTSSDALQGTVEGYITEIRSVVGLTDSTGQSGGQNAYSYVSARAVVNF